MLSVLVLNHIGSKCPNKEARSGQQNSHKEPEEILLASLYTGRSTN